MLSVLDDKLWFPNPNQALEDGLLAIGGDLSTARLLLAYRSGIFPWYNNDIPLWWHPDPRFVLFPQELLVSKSMKQVIVRNTFEFKVNSSFKEVITNCKRINRKEQDGTWINEEVIDSYTQLHKLGFAHSAEAWSNGELVGGLYGIKIGKMFFGESMFSQKSNASKFAFVKYVEQLKIEGIVLIDCQVYTEHLESLGARMILRDEFMAILKSNICY
jgi:leucyl/phenylalanyl-tRNA--protein transferase